MGRVYVHHKHLSYCEENLGQRAKGLAQEGWVRSACPIKGSGLQCTQKSTLLAWQAILQQTNDKALYENSDVYLPLTPRSLQKMPGAMGLSAQWGIWSGLYPGSPFIPSHLWTLWMKKQSSAQDPGYKMAMDSGIGSSAWRLLLPPPSLDLRHSELPQIVLVTVKLI